MLLSIIVVAVTIVAIAVNKGVKGIENKEVKFVYLIFLGFLIQIAIFNQRFASSSLNKFMPFLYIVSLIVLLVFVIANSQRYLGMKVAFVGSVLNFIVIAANGGYMPQDINKLYLAGLSSKAELLQASGKFYNAIIMSENTRLNFLGDVIAIPQLKPIASVYSIGDMFLVLGICIFIFEFFKNK